eukprot:TRINITY_DN21163_c0_g1_i2.p1 TRINITY_DN21163_c0_g1~~TRINITY_DN21163_c0_g1_i2.p1  ORF type:complete len:3630 (+),score=956.85 TRINITY_DN21163_c0_g1_i2:37-10890(+)
MPRRWLCAVLLVIAAKAARWDTKLLVHEYLLDDDIPVFADSAPFYRNRFAEPTLANFTLRGGGRPGQQLSAHPKAWPGASSTSDPTVAGALAVADWSSDDPWDGGWSVEVWLRMPAHPAAVDDDVAVLQSNATYGIVGAELTGCELAVAGGVPVFRQPEAFNESADAGAWRHIRERLLGRRRAAPPQNGSADSAEAASATLTTYTELVNATTPTLSPRRTETATLSVTATRSGTASVSPTVTPPTAVRANYTETPPAGPEEPWLPRLLPGEWAHVVWVYDASLRIVEFYVNGTYAGDTPKLSDSAPFCDFTQAPVGVFAHRQPSAGVPWGFDNLRFYSVPLTDANVSTLYHAFYQPPVVGEGSVLDGVLQVREPLTLTFLGIPPFTPTPAIDVSVRLVAGSDCAVSNFTDPAAEIAAAEWPAQSYGVTLVPARPVSPALLCMSYDGRQTWRVLAAGVVIFTRAEATSYSLTLQGNGRFVAANTLAVDDAVVVTVAGTGLVTRAGWDMLMLVRIPVSSPPSVALDDGERRLLYDSMCSGGAPVAGRIGPVDDLGPGDGEARTEASAGLQLTLSGDLVVCYRSSGGTNGGKAAPWTALWSAGTESPLLQIGTGREVSEWTTMMGIAASLVAAAAAGDAHFAGGVSGLFGPNLTARAVRVLTVAEAWVPATTAVLRFESVSAAHGQWLVSEWRRILREAGDVAGAAVNYTCPHCAAACPPEAPPATTAPTAAPGGPGVVPTPVPPPPEVLYCNLTSAPDGNASSSFYAGLPTDLGYDVGGVWAGEPFTLTVVRPQGTLLPEADGDTVRLVWGGPPPLSQGTLCEAGTPATLLTAPAGNSTHRVFTATVAAGTAASALAVCYSQPGDTVAYRTVAAVLGEAMRVSQPLTFLANPYPPFRGQDFELVVFGLSLFPLGGANDSVVLTTVGCGLLPPLEGAALAVWWGYEVQRGSVLRQTLYLPTDGPPRPYTDPVTLNEGRANTFHVPHRLWPTGQLQVCYYPGAGHGTDQYVKVAEVFQRLRVDEKPSRAAFWPPGPWSEASAGVLWGSTLWLALRNATTGSLVGNAGAKCSLALELTDPWMGAADAARSLLLGETQAEATDALPTLCDFTGAVGAVTGLFGWATLRGTATLTDGSTLSAAVQVFLRHACDASTTCGGRGVCNVNGTCDCTDSFIGGRWETSSSLSQTAMPPDIQCDRCAWQHFGASCDVKCAAATSCGGRGTCGADGSCVCSAPFAGKSCDVCLQPGHNPPCEAGTCRSGWYLADCSLLCDPQQTCTGHGRCSGQPLRDSPCECFSPWAGDYCDACHIGLAGPECAVQLPPAPRPHECTFWRGVNSTFRAVSVVFARSRRRISVTFNHPTAADTAAGSSCGQYLNGASARRLWDGDRDVHPQPHCLWADPHTLHIEVVPRATGGVAVGTVLTLRDVRTVRRTDGCPLLDNLLPPVTAPPALPPFTATLVAPASVGSCESLTLRAAVSPDLVPGVLVQWSLVPALGFRDIAAVITALASTNSTTVSLPPAVIHTEGNYRFRASVTDGWGRQLAAEATVRRRSEREDAFAGAFPSLTLQLPGSTLRQRTADELLVAAPAAPADCLFTPSYGRQVTDREAERFAYQWTVLDGLQRTVDLSQLQFLTRRPAALLHAPPGFFSPLFSPYSVSVTATSRVSFRATETLAAVLQVVPGPLRLDVSGGNRVVSVGDAPGAELVATCTDPEVPLSAGRVNLPAASVGVSWGCAGPAAIPASVPVPVPGERCAIVGAARLSSVRVPLSAVASAPPGFYRVTARCINRWINDAFPHERTVNVTSWVEVRPAEPVSRAAAGLQQNISTDSPTQPATANATAQPTANATVARELESMPASEAPHAELTTVDFPTPHPHTTALVVLPALERVSSTDLLPAFEAVRWECISGPLSGQRWAGTELRLEPGVLRPSTDYLLRLTAAVAWSNDTHRSAAQELLALVPFSTSGLVQGRLRLEGAEPTAESLGRVVAAAEGWAANDDGAGESTALLYRFSVVSDAGERVVVCPWGPHPVCGLEAPLALAERGLETLSVVVEVRDRARTPGSSVAAVPVTAVPGLDDVSETQMPRLLGRIGYRRELGGLAMSELHSLAAYLVSAGVAEAASLLSGVATLEASQMQALLGTSTAAALASLGSNSSLDVWMALFTQTGLEASTERDAAAAALSLGLTALGAEPAQLSVAQVATVVEALLALVRRRVTSLLSVPLDADAWLAARACAVADWAATALGAAPVPTSAPTAAQTTANGTGPTAAPATGPAVPSAAPTAGPVAANPAAQLEQASLQLAAAAPYLCHGLLNSSNAGAVVQWTPSAANATAKSMRVSARRTGLAVELSSAAATLPSVGAGAALSKAVGTAHVSAPVDLCTVEWPAPLLDWAPAEAGLLWGRAVPTVTVVVTGLAAAPGAVLSVSLPVPPTDGWSVTDATCGVWDDFSRTWGRQGCVRAVAAEAGGAVRCECSSPSAVMHFTLLDAQYFTPKPTPAPTPAPTPEPPPPPDFPDESITANALLLGLVGIAAVAVLRQVGRDREHVRKLAHKWRREPSSVRLLHKLLSSKGYAAGPLVSDEPAAVVEYLVSRRKAASERDPVVYAALRAAVDWHAWGHLLLQPSSLRYANVFFSERLAVAVTCALVAPLAAGVAADDDPLYFAVNDKPSQVPVLGLLATACTYALQWLLLLLLRKVPAKERESENETEVEQELAQTTRAEDGGVDIGSRMRRASSVAATALLSPETAAADSADAEPVRAFTSPRVLTAVSEDTQEPTSAVDTDRRVSFRGGADPDSTPESAPRRASLFSAVRMPQRGQSMRRRASRKQSTMSRSGGERAGELRLSFEELDYAFFDEVRDARLHAAVAVDLSKTMYSRGVLGSTVFGDAADTAADFFTIRMEDSTRRVRQLFLRTFKDMDPAEARAFLEHRMGQEGASGAAKGRRQATDGSESDSSFDDITVSDASEIQQDISRQKGADSATWSGDWGYERVWEQETTQCLWQLGVEACRMLELRLAAVLFQLALLADNPDLFCILTGRQPPGSTSEMVAVLVGMEHSVGSLFAYDCCRADSELRLPLDCFAAAFAASARPTAALVTAVCALDCSVGWRDWTWPGGAPYPIEEEVREAGAGAVGWSTVDALLDAGEYLRAAHAVRWLPSEKGPVLTTAPLPGVWAPRRLVGAPHTADGALTRRYSLPAQELPRSLQTGRLLAVYIAARRQRESEGGGAVTMHVAAQQLLADEKERLRDAGGPEHAKLRGPPLPLPPAAALRDTRNEWMAYFLNLRTAGQRGAVFVTPEQPQLRRLDAPFFSLCRCSLSKGVRRGSGTQHNPYYGMSSAVPDLREGDCVLMLPGTYPPFSLALLTPPGEETSAPLAVEVAPFRSLRQEPGSVVIAADRHRSGAAAPGMVSATVRVVSCQNVALRGLHFSGVSVRAVHSSGVTVEECHFDGGGVALSPADCCAGKGGPLEQGGCTTAGARGVSWLEPWRRLGSAPSRVLADAAVVAVFALLLLICLQLTRRLSASAGWQWLLMTVLIWAVDCAGFQVVCATAVAAVAAQSIRGAVGPQRQADSFVRLSEPPPAASAAVPVPVVTPPQEPVSESGPQPVSPPQPTGPPPVSPTAAAAQ